MAKRELSNTLKNLKFMQRSSQREEKSKGEENPRPDNGSFRNSAATPRTRCTVIMEGNPHPGALKGRMSFQSFNPSIDKLNEETANPSQMQACADHQNGSIVSDRQAGISDTRSQDSNVASTENGSDTDLKRKQPEIGLETPPLKTRKDPVGDGDDRPTPLQSNRRGSHNQQRKREKVDWNVLRPPKPQPKRS